MTSPSEVEELKRKLQQAEVKAAAAKEQARAWRNAFHSLRQSLESHLGELTTTMKGSPHD